MTRSSHAARRVVPTLRRDFPLVPTWPAEGRYEGLAFILAEGAPAPDLRPLRDAIALIRQGGVAADARLLVVAFRQPCALAAADWPGALRLSADGATLRSFVPDETGFAPALRTTRIDLWWAGERRRIALDMLAPVPLATLWDLPPATLHRSRPYRAAPGPRAAGPLSAEVLAGHTIVSQAKAPGIGTADRPLDDLARDLRRMPGQDRMLAMAAKLRRQLATRTVGKSSGAGAAPARSSGPGLFGAMLGWLRWHTPLGDRIRRQFGERMDLVDKLIAGGEVDRALQLALMLASEEREGHSPPTRYPNQLPKARASLDLDVAPAAFTSPILGDASLHQMRRQYRDLATRLEAEGDVKRAAFIHSQLLGDHRAAVLALERGEQFAEAARLALATRLDTVLAIRLLYRADQGDAALALAKRTGCFEALAADSEKAGGDYHAYVVRAWTDLLVATGQPFRAIHVTDKLARREAGDAPLHARRREWLAAALEQAADAPDGELTARALLMARWDDDGIDPRGIEAFPHRPAVRDPNPYEAAFDRLQAAVRGADDGADELLLATLAGLARVGDPDQADQRAFWQAQAPIIVDGLARGVLAVASARMVPRDFDQLTMLLHKARQPVLAEDLGKVRKLHRPAPAAPNGSWVVPPARTRQAAIRHACLIGSGTILVWREDGTLCLIDRNGTPLFHTRLSEVAGLVPIGTGTGVLVIQREADGMRLTRFASDRRSFRAIGKVDLRAHHVCTSESQWLVQIGGRIGALDLVKLCAAVPEIEFAWSCALTDRLEAIAFAHRREGAAWITRDVSDERHGILERWTFEGGGRLDAAIGLPSRVRSTDGAEVLPAPRAWFWDAPQNRAGSADGNSNWMIFSPWSDDAERDARSLKSRRKAAGVEGFDTVQSCDFGQMFVHHDIKPDGAGTIAMMRTAKPWSPIFTLSHDGDTLLRCLARRGAVGNETPPQLLLADEAGRLLLVEPEARRVLMV